jgi:hypothetical protein
LVALVALATPSTVRYADEHGRVGEREPVVESQVDRVLVGGDRGSRCG